MVCVCVLTKTAYPSTQVHHDREEASKIAICIVKVCVVQGAVGKDKERKTGMRELIYV